MNTAELTGIDQAIEKAGGQEALAATVGCSQQNVSFWKKQGYVPVLRAVEIEQATGVPRIKLINPRIWSVLDTATI